MTITVRKDRQIKAEVIDQLCCAARIDATNISVEVTKGVVTLNGTVSNHLAMQAAEESARVVAGVHRVDNNLKVSYPRGTEIPTDGKIQASIEDMLVYRPDIDSRDLHIHSEAGWVTLTGKVDAYWKKLRIEEVILNLPGVTGLTDRLTVVPIQKHQDSDIYESIITTLRQNPEIKTKRIQVVVTDGDVTIKGTVSNLSAFRTIQETVEYTPGVVDVDNELIVK